MPVNTPLILVVDDMENNRRLAAEVLTRQNYRVSKATDGVEALEKIAQEEPDLVLLDVSMPRLDGLSVLQRLRSRHETELLPVILVTAQHDVIDRVRGLDAGASDFLAKPWEASELLARVRAQLRMRKLTRELEHAEQVLYMLARVIDARDAYTQEHTERVAKYAIAIGAAMNLSAIELQTLHKGAILHDIGKIGLPDAILRKPGPLTSDEQRHMQMHPGIGVEITQTLQSLGEAFRVIRHHHERWDGHGYPDALKEQDIPLFARIVSIADAFDAMTTKRPYHQGRSFAEARCVLAQGAGVIWDPALVAIALQVLPQERSQQSVDSSQTNLVNDD